MTKVVSNPRNILKIIYKLFSKYFLPYLISLGSIKYPVINMKLSGLIIFYVRSNTNVVSSMIVLHTIFHIYTFRIVYMIPFESTNF